nr:hypothetical protein YSBCXYJI_YSBCXYJI_CDS_0028 [Caudoviricetes sp.]
MKGIDSYDSDYDVIKIFLGEDTLTLPSDNTLSYNQE